MKAFATCKLSLIKCFSWHSGGWPYKPPLMRHNTNFDPEMIWTLLPNLTFTLLCKVPLGICGRCGVPTGDACSSGRLVLSNFGTCMCSNVEANLSWTCLVSGRLNFEHPSVLLFCLQLHDILDDDHIQWHPPLIGHYTNFWPLLI